jgi:hypothetical protein
MINNKLLISFLGILLAILTISFANKNLVKENYILGQPIEKKAMLQTGSGDNGQSVMNQYSLMLNSSNLGFSKENVNTSVNLNTDFYQVPPNLQSTPPPRIFSEGYGPNIRYNPPPERYMAVPTNPVHLGKMVSNSKENYCGGSVGGGCGIPVGCKKGGQSPDNVKGYQPEVKQSGYSAGNYNNVASKTGYGKYAPSGDINNDDSLAVFGVGNMTTASADGEINTIATTNVLVNALPNKFLRGRACPIRGDVPVASCNFQWFNVAANPNLDLGTGALSVIGGLDNDQGKQLAELVAVTSGGSNTTGGGVDLAQTNMANSFTSSLGTSLADTIVTSYP